MTNFALSPCLKADERSGVTLNMAVAKNKSVTPHIVILTSTIVKGLNDILQGVLQYAQEHGPWRICQQENRPWMYQLKDVTPCRSASDS